MSEISKQKISQKTKGKLHPTTSIKLKGIKRSHKTKIKISQNIPHKSKVYQYDLQGKLIKIWDSIKETERNNKGNIKNNLLNKTKHSNGYIWLKEKDNNIQELNKRLNQMYNYKHPLKNKNLSKEHKYNLSKSIKGKKSNYKQNNLNLDCIKIDYNNMSTTKLASKYNISIPTMINYLKNNNKYKFHKNY